MRKTAVLLALLLAATLMAGCATTQVKDTWKKPEFTGKVKRVYLIGVTRNDKLRKLFEDEFARQLATLGATGIPSYPDLQISGDIDRETLRARLRAQGTDAVLVARLAGKEQRTAAYSAGEAGYGIGTAPINVYYDEYVNSSVTIVTAGPAVASDFQVVNISAKLFDTETAQVIWSALTETSVSDDKREQRLREFAETVTRKLKEDGLL
jgi:hypothetical protein